MYTKEMGDSSRASPPKGPRRRNSIARMAATSDQDTSTETVPNTRSKDIFNAGSKDRSFNETEENSQSFGLVDEEEEDDEDRPESVGEGDTDYNINKNASATEQLRRMRCTPEVEKVRRKVAQSPVKSSAPEDTKLPRNQLFWLMLAFVIVMLAFVFTSKYLSVPKKETIDRHSCKHFLQLHSKYPNTDDMLWHTLIVGVERAINQNPGEPATFIFLYNSSSVGQSLLDDVTRITIKCFGSGGAIWRTSDDFNSIDMAQDYEVILDRHREELKSHGVLVVRDLDQVPPNAAQVFFTICDSYEPLVRKAVIYFTIDISQQPKQVHQSQLSPTAIAEGILKKLWRKELNPNVLDPLVVRLTENVFRIA